MKPNFISRTAAIWLIGALAAKAVAANTHDEPPPVFQGADQYVSTHFTTDDGLPGGVVDSIIQSPDGFLWLVLAGGLLTRFDGRHFMTLQPPREQVRALAASTEGDLWILSRRELERIPADVSRLGTLPGIHYQTELSPQNSFICLHLSRNGVLLAGASDGLYRLEGNVLKSIAPGFEVYRIDEGAEGRLLLSTSQGFTEWDGATSRPRKEIADQLGLTPVEVYRVFEDSRGVTWICTARGVARRVGGSIAKLKPWRQGNAILHVHEDPRGNVWFGGVEGLFRAGAAGSEKVAKWYVRSIYGDRDDNLWVGTNGQGLIRLRERAIRMFTTEDGLPSNIPMSVLASHDGALWTGFNCGGLTRFDGHTFQTFAEKDGLLNSCVWSLAEDANHDLWVGTYGGGAFRFHNGAFTQHSKAQGLPSEIVTIVLAARDGSVWLGTPKGLIRFRHGQHRTYTRSDGLSENDVISLREDHSGSIWVGTSEGVDRLVGDRFVSVALLNYPAFILGEDSSGAVSWSSGARGVYHLENGKLIKILPDFIVREWIQSEQRDLWFTATRTGQEGNRIFRLPSSALGGAERHDEPLDYVAYGSVDGMGRGEPSVGAPNSVMMRDGKLWVATTEGLARLDVARLSTSDRKPAIYVKEIIVGRNRQAAGQQLTLPAGTRHLELRFDAIEISAPEKIRLQYRMDGVDTEWLDAAAPGHATYTNIPPGTQAFRIRASSRAGIWDRAGIAYSVTQLPFFYETALFRALCVMALLAMIWVVYQVRLRQLTRRFSMTLEARLNERTRIARELHDTLLQSFQGAMLKFQAVTYMLTDRPEARKSLESIIERAREAIIEGRDAVQDLRSSTLIGNDLAKAIGVLGEDLLAGHNGQSQPHFGMKIEGETRKLVPVVCGEAYHIAREALRNAFRYSEAKRIEVEIHYDPKQFRLCVRDNGRGIDAQVLDQCGREKHYGLPGMHERAKLAGGKFAIWSEIGSGTAAELIVPASIAYAKAVNAGRAVFFRKGDRVS